MSLHQVDYARRYCRRVIALKEGCIQFDGPCARLNDARLMSLYGASVIADNEVAPRPVMEPALAFSEASSLRELAV